MIDLNLVVLAFFVLFSIPVVLLMGLVTFSLITNK